MDINKAVNPYQFPAGTELDDIIHRKLFGKQASDGSAPRYSTDDDEAAKVRARLKATYGKPIVTGRTRMQGRPHFARYESDPSTSTEVVAETEALAACRLALLLLRRGE